MSNTTWLLVALAAVVLLVGGYVTTLMLRIRNAARRTEELSGTPH